MTDLFATTALVQAKLDSIAAAVQRFATKAGLSCPTGCGACCHSPEVEAMPVELLPMANHILASGVNVETSGLTCPMFRPDAQNKMLGRCGAYQFRPSICRIFPYGFSRDKNGGFRWRQCSKMENPAASINAAIQDVLAGNGVSYEVARHSPQDLAPNMAETMPINAALSQAVNALGLRQAVFEEKPGVS